MEAPHKGNSMVIIRFNYTTRKNSQGIKVSIHRKAHLCSHGTIYNGQNLEAAWMFINRRVDVENGVHTQQSSIQL